MNEIVQWHIGKEGIAGTRLNTPPYRAFFYWVQDGVLLRAEDFASDELSVEIQRRELAGEDATPFREALACIDRR